MADADDAAPAPAALAASAPLAANATASLDDTTVSQAQQPKSMPPLNAQREGTARPRSPPTWDSSGPNLQLRLPHKEGSTLRTPVSTPGARPGSSQSQRQSGSARKLRSRPSSTRPGYGPSGAYVTSAMMYAGDPLASRQPRSLYAEHRARSMGREKTRRKAPTYVPPWVNTAKSKTFPARPGSADENFAYGANVRPRSSMSMNGERVDPYRWLASPHGDMRAPSADGLVPWPRRPSEWFYTTYSRPATPVSRPGTPSAFRQPRSHSSLGFTSSSSPQEDHPQRGQLTLSVSVVDVGGSRRSSSVMKRADSARPYGKEELREWQSQPHIGKWLEEVDQRKIQASSRRIHSAMKELRWIETRRTAMQKSLAAAKKAEQEEKAAQAQYKRHLVVSSFRTWKKSWETNRYWHMRISQSTARAVEFARTLNQRRGWKVWKNYIQAKWAARIKKGAAAPNKAA
ncbi:hypothetical protein RI054_08g44890 [Pseudoscourfieldia marina]